jgi:hypothetical protein
MNFVTYCIHFVKYQFETINFVTEPYSLPPLPVYTGWKSLPGPGRIGCTACTPVHCCQIAENSAKKLKGSGRKKLFTARNWSGTLAEIAEK